MALHPRVEDLRMDLAPAEGHRGRRMAHRPTEQPRPASLTSCRWAPSFPAMRRRSPTAVVFLAFILLAPPFICVADPSGVPAPGGARRIAATDGPHCFCHAHARPSRAAIGQAEAPTGTLVYIVLTADKPARAARSARRPEANAQAYTLPSPEPFTPPPIPV
jgi:hypothetical protein